ncbi:NADH-quinone oxidoreductase subunit D [Frankliniella fusca]|uniref:NADH-quinone oxidoreductase subunit D n=1 Tax=Frankliniella fusca TaxID=407009 RepID=A0AAE1HVY4_9NEOP|nr:NADH-quinone oxidoreductase subunit D [Frankliniella fusca]
MIIESVNEYAEIDNILSHALENTALGLECFVSSMNESFIILNDLIIVPSNINIDHWVLFLVLTKLKCIIILDRLFP